MRNSYVQHKSLSIAWVTIHPFAARRRTDAAPGSIIGWSFIIQYFCSCAIILLPLANYLAAVQQGSPQAGHDIVSRILAEDALDVREHGVIGALVPAED